MTGEQESENRLSNKSSKPEIGTEVWGSSRPLTKVRGAKWIPIGFGKDDLHPQRPTGWKLIKNEKPLKKPIPDSNGPPLFTDQELNETYVSPPTNNSYGVDLEKMQKDRENKPLAGIERSLPVGDRD